MNAASLSVYGFGSYLTVLGGWLSAHPNSLLWLFGVEPTREIWIRFVGMLCLCLGWYCFVAAKTNFWPFIRWSVVVRTLTGLMTFAFVVFGSGPTILLLLGLTDIGAAFWTYVALQRSSPGAHLATN